MVQRNPVKAKFNNKLHNTQNLNCTIPSVLYGISLVQQSQISAFRTTMHQDQSTSNLNPFNQEFVDVLLPFHHTIQEWRHYPQP